ncbi:TolC family protein [Rubripirellula amarantea]|nr:TolC family protein [Rubripirellula amarantea]
MSSLLTSTCLLGCASGKQPQRPDTVASTTTTPAMADRNGRSSTSNADYRPSITRSPFQVVSALLASDDLDPYTAQATKPADVSEGLIAEVEAAIEQSHQRELGIESQLPAQTSDYHRPFNSAQTPENFRDLTEAEMLAVALANSPVLRPLGVQVLANPEAVTTTYDPQIAATDPFFGPQAALSEFDSRLSLTANAQNNDRVFNNTIVGGNAQELTQDLATVNAGLQKRTLSGATIQLGANHLYDNNNRTGNLFQNYWETQWEAGVRQPLLQGAGRNFNLIAGPNAQPGFNFSNGIVIARLNVKVTEADFEIEVRDFVRDLYATYWQLQQQYAVYQSVREAEDLAYRTWQTVLARRNASVLGGEANKEAQARARYYSFLRQRQTALGGESGQGSLYVVERRLRMLMGIAIVDGQLLRPVDDASTARFAFDFDGLVGRAMDQRTELTRQSLRVRQQELKMLAAKNFLLPQLDLIGRYRMRGFGDDLTGEGSRFSSAYNDLTSLDHQEWEFGVEMGVAAGRRQAKAAVRNALLQLNREQTVLAEQQRSVRHEVADAHAEVASSFAALEATLAQVDAARDRLDASQAQYEADKIQIEFLLDAQEELLRAETQLASDLSRYALSLVNIGTATGSLLNDLGIFISNSGCGSHPVYAGT